MINQRPIYLVSVIIPFLNEEIFLREAVESVLHQDYDNWELILVDDGSSDNSVKIAKDFANANPDKIIYTEHQDHHNMGLSASRNHGISMARGELVALLDADDVWLPAKLRLQVDLMKEHPLAAMICEASEYWYSWNKDYHSIKNKVIQVGKQRDKIFFPPELVEILYPLSNGPAPCPSGIIVRKAVFNKHGGFEGHFTGKYQLYEDQAFFSKIYLNEAVYISSLCNNKYRQREGSLVQKVVFEGNYSVVRKFYLEWLQQYMRENNMRFENIERLLKKAFEPYNRPAIHFLKKVCNRFIIRFKNLSTLWARH